MTITQEDPVKHSSKITPWLIAVAAGACSVSANAAVVYLDQFVVTKNGNDFFTDDFSDGSPPPSAPSLANGQATSYSVFGTFKPDTEAEGLLRLDSADGGLTENAPEQDRLTLRATLSSSTDSSNLDTGLKSDDTLNLKGVFSLSSPTGPLINGYGIRFTDRNVDGVSQMAELHVRFNPATGKVEIRYILQDFDAKTITQVGLADLIAPTDADQIELALARPDINNDDFYASYSYLNDGSVVGGDTFATPIRLFQGEQYVRAEFHAFESLSVPEPGTLALLSLGVFGLAAVRRPRA
jgi:hypothetical protein